MNNRGSTGITSMILLISFILIAITAASIMSEETQGTTSETDIQQMTDEIFNEIANYIQIKDQKGKYYKIDSELKITKIALLVSPLVSNEINLNQFNIQICTDENLRMFSYAGDSVNLKSNTLFEHDIWNNINESSFGLIVINDEDESIIYFDTINKNSDNAYLIIKLPEDLQLEKNDEIQVTMFPSIGIKKTLDLKAPMPMKSVITFE